MEFNKHEKQLYTVVIGFLVLFPVLCASTFTASRATYYGTPDGYGTPSGACGFGEYGRTVNNGYVSAVSRALYKDGAGCGACYQVRCKNPHLCTYDGVNIVVTDYGEGDRTDFILSPRAFSKLALPNLDKKLMSYGVVEVEYKRISCNYYPTHHINNSVITYKISEHSNYPYYLALTILHVSGKNDITAVELWQKETNQWKAMRRVYGAVWDMANPPRGPITLRFQATTNLGYTYWVYSTNAIPKLWKAGAAYQANVKLIIPK
ncbi:expansin-like B1 [Cannabis sativa]|uniref:expansin-like B1 n=1 Tax=Cannabis sativa TaxID=3483 RepID=UPI0029CA5B83|nr:expansin-like B1 [Cannabis sativa]